MKICEHCGHEVSERSIAERKEVYEKASKEWNRRCPKSTSDRWLFVLLVNLVIFFAVIHWFPNFASLYSVTLLITIFMFESKRRDDCKQEEMAKKIMEIERPDLYRVLFVDNPAYLHIGYL